MEKLLPSSRLRHRHFALSQVQHIEELEELLLRNEPALLDEFLPELVPLQVSQRMLPADRAAATLPTFLCLSAQEAHASALVGCLTSA
jgi:hypothetical protein